MKKDSSNVSTSFGSKSSSVPGNCKLDMYSVQLKVAHN